MFVLDQVVYGATLTVMADFAAANRSPASASSCPAEVYWCLFPYAPLHPRRDWFQPPWAATRLQSPAGACPHRDRALELTTTIRRFAGSTVNVVHRPLDHS